MYEVITLENTGIGLHKVTLTDRKSGKLNGIKDVISFDEQEIVLDTEQGLLTIKGEKLHVSRLSLEKGEVDVDGRIDSFVYSKDSSTKTDKGSGMFARFFG